jgi:glycosyltransferase involved in cell wall biosynthesis
MSRRVVLVSNTAWYLYNFRCDLFSALLEQGDQVIAVAPTDDFSERLSALGCEVVSLPMDNMGTSPLRDLATWRRLRRTYRALAPDVVLHFTIKPVIYGTLAARSLSVPVVNTVTGLGTAFLRGGPVQAVVEGLYGLSQGWPKRIFFQNPDDLGLFVGRGLVPKDRVARLPGSGVDLERFAPRPGPSGTAPVFLLIARLLWDKGVREFIEAARVLRGEDPRLRFQLLGPLGVANQTAVPKPEIERWVGEGVVEFLGETEDVRPWIAQADCVVLPSYREGTPRALLEAAAMGRPIIATDVPGCREVLTDGVTGLLCRVRDSADLADKMRQMAGFAPELRLAMGMAGRAKMKREFDQRIVIGRYLEAIDHAVGPR